MKVRRGQHNRTVVMFMAGRAANILPVVPLWKVGQEYTVSCDHIHTPQRVGTPTETKSYSTCNTFQAE